MLAGLIFATHDAVDRPQMLAATLPFGGATLIEYQARLLSTVGATHLVIVISRLTPELLSAISRIQRRDLTVDVVRNAAEASDKLHPLARIVVIADSLITTAAVAAILADEGPDALLVADGAMPLPNFERVGASAVWAGVARLRIDRIKEVAALPPDYAFESTLLRVAAQAGAEQVALPATAIAAGHCIERDSTMLKQRNNLVVLGFVPDRIGWVDRFVIAPLARRLLPILTHREVPAVMLAGVALPLLGAGLALTMFRLGAFGMPVAAASIIALSLASLLSLIQDQHRTRRLIDIGAVTASVAALLSLGYATAIAMGSATPPAVTLSLVVTAGLAERATDESMRRWWWGSPAAYPIGILPFVWAGAPMLGLCAGALYATASLAAAIERLRRKALGAI